MENGGNGFLGFAILIVLTLICMWLKSLWDRGIDKVGDAMASAIDKKVSGISNDDFDDIVNEEYTYATPASREQLSGYFHQLPIGQAEVLEDTDEHILWGYWGRSHPLRDKSGVDLSNGYSSGMDANYDITAELIYPRDDKVKFRFLRVPHDSNRRSCCDAAKQMKAWVEDVIDSAGKES